MSDPQVPGESGDGAFDAVQGPQPVLDAEVRPDGEPAEPGAGAAAREAGTEATADATVEAAADATLDVPIKPPPGEPLLDLESAGVEPAGDAPADVTPADVVPAGIEPVRVEPPDVTPVDEPKLVALDDIALAIAEASVTRRAFLGFGLALVGGLAGAVVLSRLVPIFEDTANAASPVVPTYDPAGKAWTFVVDSSACIGCGLCVVACKDENHVPEESEYTRTWVERHTVTSDGVLYVDSPDAGIHGFPPESTAPGAAGKTVASAHFEPRLCMQCENPPCTSVCPVGATYRTADGVILVDARRCIGCGYCVVACPYGARYIVPAGESAPSDTPGVADKCTWCYHRISRGGTPACVEVCPVGARKFGDASDPSSEIATIVREQSPQPLHPEYGTSPRVLYLGPSIEEA